MQSTLTFGDYWLALTEPTLTFGRFWTLEEIAAESLAGYASDDCDQAHVLANGYGEMYSCIHQPPNDECVHDYFNKAAVWPIEETLYRALDHVGWSVLGLREHDTLMLEHSLRGFQGWLAEKA